jgi:ribosomal-protein-alanine N-acetyltransferase
LIENSYSLRIFNPSDLDAVVNINRICLPENYAPYFFLDTYHTLPEAFVVAESQAQVVGYIMCRIEHGFSDMKKLHFAKKGHIISVAVMPEFRRIGVGYSLVQRILSALTSMQADECYLEVRVSNNAAIELYRRIGFDIARSIPRYYYDGSDAYVMIKSI